MSTSQVFKELEFLGFDPLSIREALRNHKDFDSALHFLNSNKNLQIEANLSTRGIPKGAAKKLGSMFNSADDAEKFYTNYLPEAAKIRASGIEMGFPLNIIERTIEQFMPFDEAIENISSQTIQRNLHSVALKPKGIYEEPSPEILFSENYENQAFNAKRRGYSPPQPNFEPPRGSPGGNYGELPQASPGYQPFRTNPPLAPPRMPPIPSYNQNSSLTSGVQLSQNYSNYINNPSPLLRPAPQSVNPYYQNNSYANPSFPNHSTQQPFYRYDQSPPIHLSQSGLLPPPPLYPNHNPLANWQGGPSYSPTIPQPSFPPTIPQTTSQIVPPNAAINPPRFNPQSLPQANQNFPPVVNAMPAHYPQINPNVAPLPMQPPGGLMPSQGYGPPAQLRINPGVNNSNPRAPPNYHPQGSQPAIPNMPNNRPVIPRPQFPQPGLNPPFQAPIIAPPPRIPNQLGNLPPPQIQRLDSGVSISVNRGNQPPQNFVLERNLGNNFEEAYDTISLTLNNRTLNNRGIRLEGADQDYMVLEFTDFLEGLYGRLALIQILANMYEPQGMSEEEINHLQRLNYSKSMKLTSETCVICYDDFEEGIQIVMLSCSHPFHTDCISTWLKNSTKCPLCKNDMAENAA